MGVLRHSFTPDVAYKIVFGVTMGLRLVAIGFLVPVVEQGSTSIRATLKHLSKVSPRGYKALKQLSQSADVATRASAIASVGQQNFGIAVDEILKSLHDPSPRIRRQAASALAKMDDPRATEALIHQITDHPALVEEETIEALGDLGSPEAIPHLERYLDSMRSQLRRAAAHALAKIGDPRAIEPLVRASQKPNDPDLRYACLQALRTLEACEAEPVITDALFDPHPSVRIAAAEAIAELDLRGAGPVLRESLTWYDDEAASEVAYALGAVGEVDDLPLILETAQKCVSIITRRRCLLGAARMLGVETDVYRLFLQEGMSRDAGLLDLLKAHIRSHRALRNALDRYSSGDEATALHLLAEWRRRPELVTMAQHPVEESFLVAVCAAVLQPSPRASKGAGER